MVYNSSFRKIKFSGVGRSGFRRRAIRGFSRRRPLRATTVPIAIMKKILILLSISFTLASCTSRSEKLLTKKELRSHKFAAEFCSGLEDSGKAKIDEIYEKMSDEERIAQMFLVNIVGDRDFRPVEKLVPGGCILFSYNIGKSKQEVKAFTDSIKKYCEKNGIFPPYITLDQEGGYVNRLRGITSPLPSQKRVANENSVEEAYKLYRKQGAEMAELGLTLNLAPVSEVETEKNAAFLDTRTYGNFENTVKYSLACVNGYENSGVGAVLKHFPGNSDTDPHTGLPEISVTKAELERDYILPFKKVLSSGVTAVIMSHARVTVTDDNTFDTKTPACLSKFWVDEMLRKEMGFSGLVISDDIFMGALADNGFPPETAAVAAIKAGVNILMLSEKRFVKVAEDILEKAKTDKELSENIEKSVKKIIGFKIGKI